MLSALTDKKLSQRCDEGEKMETKIDKTSEQLLCSRYIVLKKTSIIISIIAIVISITSIIIFISHKTVSSDELRDLPYISLSNYIIEMSLDDSPKTICAQLVNGDTSDIGEFYWLADSDKIDMICTGDIITIKPIKPGNTTIYCSHPKAEFEKAIYIIVKDNQE